MLVEALLFLAVTAGIGFLLYEYLIYKPPYLMKLVPLKQSPTTCISMNSANGFGAWNSSTPCTIRFFLFLQSVGRTQESPPDCVATPYMPGCAVTEVSAYKCTADCNAESEKFNTSYLKSIFRLQNNFMDFMIAANTSDSTVPAFLKLKTGYSSGVDNSYLESVLLPAVPLQAWTMITITKDGKRIDVFYNSKRVASKVLQYAPLESPSANTYMCGNPQTEGTIGYTQWSKGAMTKEQVAAEYTALTNTKGVPRAINELNFDISTLTAPDMCMFGTCNPMPAVAPADPFSVWNVRAY
jgi:hypothetical protein